MSEKLLIDQGPVETRAALINAQGHAERFWFGPGAGETAGMMPGDAYVGKIRAVDRRLAAAFVDIGEARDGFWPLKKRAVAEGELLPFEVKRLPDGNKGAVLALARGGVPHGVDKPGRISPRLLAAEAALAYFDDCAPRQIIVSSGILRQRFGDDERIEVEDTAYLFERHGAEEALEQALTRILTLDNGNRLTFDEAEALTVVDVDLGAGAGQSRSGAALRLCRETVPHLMAQLRLRGIGGQVVVDFPSLDADSRQTLYEDLVAALKPLPNAKWAPLTKLGLFAFSLRSRGPSLLTQLTEPTDDSPVAGRRFTTRAIAARLVRRLEQALEQDRTGIYDAFAGDAVIGLIDANPDWSQFLSEKYGGRFHFVLQPDAAPDWFDVAEERT